MTRWLAIAEWLCGAHARHTVFEPLIADWQRQWHEAPPSGWSRARVAVAGVTAFVIALASCVVSGGPGMKGSDVMRGATALLLSTIALLAMQMVWNAQMFRTNYVYEVQFWMALPMIAPLAIPLAMLPAMMLMRGRGVAARSAVAITIVASALTVVATGWLTPKLQGDIISPRLDEAMYQQSLADDRAGRYTYPGSAIRHLRQSTPEQRAERWAEFRRNPRYIAAMAERTRPRWGRSAFLAGGLTLAFASFGWALGALGRTRPRHAIGWWALGLLTIMVLDGRVAWMVSNNVVVPFGRSSPWVPIGVFATAAIVILVAVHVQKPRRAQSTQRNTF